MLRWSTFVFTEWVYLLGYTLAPNKTKVNNTHAMGIKGLFDRGKFESTNPSASANHSLCPEFI